MSEMRWNPVLGEWVITATHRQDRTFFPPADYCPLCPTRQGGFATEIPREDYEFVVLENKFPSLVPHPPTPALVGTDLYKVSPSVGACEVVLYSPDHESTLTDLPVGKLVQLIKVWRDRYQELGSRPEIEYVFIFENKGKEIGVTIHHPHGQIYAFSYLPPRILCELENANKHHGRTGRCLHCDILAHETKDRRRLVVESQRFVAFVPFYARFPYEVHVYSKYHLSSMAEFEEPDEEDLALILKTVLQKYDNLWSLSMPYMMVMHQEPTDGRSWPGSHFHIEFYPPLRTKEKLKYLAGCESGAGTFINDTLPEEKAAELRACEPYLVIADEHP
ncbi:MAG: galactose-1-phosphate uridylyltransferase [Candidatus Melainabacteria bacterium]|nr:galactose-1-phosphate uridylyltransferase [Candidatus Melainabacteria bacterium]